MTTCESPSVRHEPTSVWIGFQDGCGNIPGFDLYNLLVAIPGHPEGSIVTAATLVKAGLEVPEKGQS